MSLGSEIAQGVDANYIPHYMRVDDDGNLQIGGEIDAALGLIAPASYGFAITPSNTVDLPHETRSIFVGASGNITVDFVDGGTNILLMGCTAGTVLPVRVKRVYQTGTGATNLVGLY